MAPLPTPALDNLLGSLRGLLVGHVRRHGFGKLLLASSLGLAFLFIADLALDLPGPVRVLHLVLLTGGLGYLFWRYIKRPLAAIPDKVGLAVLVERAHPELSELFTSAKQLSEAPAESEAQGALIQSVIQRAETVAASFKMDAVDDPQVPRKALLHGLGAFFVAALLLGSDIDRSSIFFSRIAGGGPAWPRATTLLVEVPFTGGTVSSSPDGALVEVSCARGSDIPIVIRAEGVVPDEVTLKFASGARTVLNVTRGGIFRTLLRSVQEDVSFGVIGGDDDDGKPEVAVSVLRPPDISGIAIQITPPSYTNEPPYISSDADIDVLAGSTLRVSALTDPPGAQGIVRLLPADSELELLDGLWPVTDGTASPEGETEDPARACKEFSFEPMDSVNFRFELTDDRGLTNPDPGLFAVRVIPDRSPDIEMLSPVRGEVETVPGGAITLRARIADDHGLGALEARLRPTPSDEAIVIPTETRELSTWTAQHKEALFLTALLELGDPEDAETSPSGLPVIPGQTLELELSAKDRREPATAESESKSSPIRVRVVSPDEFLRRLQDRLARVRANIAELLTLESEKASQAQALLIALDSDTLDENMSSDAANLTNGLRRLHGDARSISRELAELTDNVIHARLEERGASLLAALVAATKEQTDRSFSPQIWRALATRDDAKKGLTGRLIRVTSLAIEITDDLIEPARSSAELASRATDPATAQAAIADAVELEAQAIVKTEQLLAELAEWDNFQSVLSLTRDILNRQKSLTERARHYAKEN